MVSTNLGGILAELSDERERFTKVKRGAATFEKEDEDSIPDEELLAPDNDEEVEDG